ncbi:flagellar biosynthesis anti-sigma factor FlgM [Halomonas sp. WWR20]
MKIDTLQSLTRLPGQEKSGNSTSTVSDTTRTAPATAATVTTLSQAASGDAGQDIDTARVAEIRQAISEGRLDIRSDKIADGLIQSVRDLLGE